MEGSLLVYETHCDVNLYLNINKNGIHYLLWGICAIDHQRRTRQNTLHKNYSFKKTINIYFTLSYQQVVYIEVINLII